MYSISEQVLNSRQVEEEGRDVVVSRGEILRAALISPALDRR